MVELCDATAHQPDDHDHRRERSLLLRKPARHRPGVTYNVVVAASNFAAGGPLQGTNNTVDPDGGNNSTSQLTLTTGSPTNLAQTSATQPPRRQHRQPGLE